MPDAGASQPEGLEFEFALPVFKHVTGKRLLYRPLAGINEVISVGIARAKNGDLTPAGEKFCESLRQASYVANPRAARTVKQETYRERGQPGCNSDPLGLHRSRKLGSAPRSVFWLD
jgi:hypothetical protein